MEATWKEPEISLDRQMYLQRLQTSGQHGIEVVLKQATGGVFGIVVLAVIFPFEVDIHFLLTVFYHHIGVWKHQLKLCGLWDSVGQCSGWKAEATPGVPHRRHVIDQRC